jgi:diguanylate cyclase (GGDEF)-like protein
MQKDVSAPTRAEDPKPRGVRVEKNGMSQVPHTLISVAHPSTTVARLERENATLRAELRRLSELAYRDPLTGLRNRRALKDRLAEELARALRSGEAFSVVAIDLNGFKALNDTWGHEVGDDALRWVSRLLESTVRTSDTVYRLGGDEFLVLMPATCEEKGRIALERLKARSCDVSRTRIPMVSLAMGLATWQGGRETGEAVMARADAAMYVDKHAGRTRM